jgi:hypothetical protein
MLKIILHIFQALLWHDVLLQKYLLSIICIEVLVKFRKLIHHCLFPQGWSCKEQIMHINEMFTLIDDCQVNKDKIIKLVWCWQWIKMGWEICDITGYISIKLVVLFLNIFLNHLHIHICMCVHVLYVCTLHMCWLSKIFWVVI